MQKSPDKNPVLVKSYSFALRVIKAYQYLVKKKKEFVLSKQLLRSGTSIGANTKEAVYAQSKREFIAKMNIALKEAHESEYWILLLRDSDYFTNTQSHSLLKDVDELIRLLTAIIKSSHKVHSTF